MKTQNHAILILVCVLMIASPAAIANQIEMPFLFVDGTIANADDVNDNFSTLLSESNDQDSRITAMENRLQLNIVTSQGLANPGDAANAFIVLSVYSSEGPVNDLAESNFVVSTKIVPAGGSAMTVSNFYNLGAGNYRFSVVPGTNVWKDGRYLFTINLYSTSADAVVAGDLDINP